MRMIAPYMQLEDPRGSFLGIVNFGNWEELNYVETKAGEVRGGHYHKETLELFFIIDGEIDIRIEDLNHNLVKEVTVGRNAIFIIDPHEVHIFICRTECRWINVLSKRIDAQAPDIHLP